MTTDTEPADQIEEWRPVPGWEGLYDVSSLGRVRSRSRTVDHPRSGRLTISGRILRAARGSHGYPSVALSRDGLVEARTVHSLVAEAFLGRCPEGQQVRHLDGDRKHPAADNLAYGDEIDQWRDRHRHRTAGRKLTPEQVAEIRARLAAGERQCDLASIYGVDPSLISRIHRGVAWSEAA